MIIVFFLFFGGGGGGEGGIEGLIGFKPEKAIYVIDNFKGGELRERG